MTVGRRHQPRFKAKRRPKFGNVKTTEDGITFDSKLERDRYRVLETYQNTGLIRDLQRQVRYKLTAHDEVICAYVADFEYLATPECTLCGSFVVTEDSKGVLTRDFKIKARLFKAQEGRKINIITRENINSLPEKP